MFTDAQFMSAAEKELVLRQWKRFIQALLKCKYDDIVGADYGSFPASLDKPFTDRLYKHLSLHCGFIAHYNRRGFLSARFGDRGALQETIDRLHHEFVMADYRDIHQAMLAELKPWEAALLVNAPSEV